MSDIAAPREAGHGRSRFLVPALVGVAALLVLFGYGVVASGPSRSLDQTLSDGKRQAAPDLSLAALGAPGKRTLAGYRGKVVVVNFWASWCPPCRDEAPVLERMQQRMSARGGVVLGVDVLDVSGDALAFAREQKITYPLARDRDGSAAHDFGVAGYPETVVVDRQGRVAAIQRGPVDEAFWRETLAPLLKERT